MRIRRGKGQILAFDATLEKRLEELRKAKDFYPTLKEIGESYSPAHSPFFIDRALRRLREAGRLSDEACLVYASKTKKEKGNEKSVKKRK
jgi:hypothetical protein